MLHVSVLSRAERPMADYRQIMRELRGRRARLVDQLDKLDATIQMLEETIRVSQPEFDFATPADTLEEQVVKRERGELPPETIARYARETLLEFGKPMKRGELVRALEQKGVPLAGKDKNKNLGTILWRHGDMFVSLAGLGYWPRDVRIPGVYDVDPETGRPVGEE